MVAKACVIICNSGVKWRDCRRVSSMFVDAEKRGRSRLDLDETGDGDGSDEVE